MAIQNWLIYKTFIYFSDITILSDTKNGNYHHAMDIVVSVTSEAAYESQWLKFNFDRIKDYMRLNAILIPRQSTLTVVPVTSAKVCSFLHSGDMKFKYREQTHGLENYANRAQTVCPLYTRNLYECATHLELFSFNYLCNQKERVQIESETRLKRLNFKIERDCMVTGFCGYFQSTLYKNITLNNRTMFRNDNEDCVPMVYFPLKCPQSLNAQTELKTQFWLNFNACTQKHWYEWTTTAPISMVHNLNGDVCALRNPMGHLQ